MKERITFAQKQILLLAISGSPPFILLLPIAGLPVMKIIFVAFLIIAV